ncbi:hypothetical protein [Empedobacter sp.]|uniref:hypothetical protein n=1 Tax=Empedobacter sp. TaxID=1927715 RepID=UPI0028AA9241|nr:hypothetical protein [Empedobacter sp.]
MKKMFLFFILFSLFVNAQIVNLIIIDVSNSLPIDDSDVYFKKSTKNFVSGKEGKAIVDLSNVDVTDELIISKKDYQDLIIKVSTIKSDLNVRLRKIPKIELEETVVSNLKPVDVLKKVIENYEKNFNVDKYYFLVDLTQKYKIDTVYESFINLDLQFKFDKGKVKVKSSGEVKNKYEKGSSTSDLTFETSDYFKHLYLYEGFKLMYKNLLKNEYINTKLVFTKYADKPMYEVYLDKSEDEKNYLLIDKESFSVVEYVLRLKNEIKTNNNYPLQRDGVMSFKYRPYLDSWVLKESEVKFTMNLVEENKEDIKIDFLYKIQTFNFDTKPFPKFMRSINLNRNIKNQF